MSSERKALSLNLPGQNRKVFPTWVCLTVLVFSTSFPPAFLERAPIPQVCSQLTSSSPCSPAVSSSQPRLSIRNLLGNLTKCIRGTYPRSVNLESLPGGSWALLSSLSSLSLSLSYFLSILGDSNVQPELRTTVIMKAEGMTLPRDLGDQKI